MRLITIAVIAACLAACFATAAPLWRGAAASDPGAARAPRDPAALVRRGGTVPLLRPKSAPPFFLGGAGGGGARLGAFASETAAAAGRGLEASTSAGRQRLEGAVFHAPPPSSSSSSSPSPTLPRTAARVRAGRRPRPRPRHAQEQRALAHVVVVDDTAALRSAAASPRHGHGPTAKTPAKSAPARRHSLAHNLSYGIRKYPFLASSIWFSGTVVLDMAAVVAGVHNKEQRILNKKLAMHQMPVTVEAKKKATEQGA